MSIALPNKTPACAHEEVFLRGTEAHRVLVTTCKLNKPCVRTMLSTVTKMGAGPSYGWHEGAL